MLWYVIIFITLVAYILGSWLLSKWRHRPGYEERLNAKTAAFYRGM